MAKIAKKEASTSGVRLTFSNGEIVEAAIDSFNEDIIYRLAAHGLSQKLGDSYASANEKGWTVEDCANGVRDILRNLDAGVWASSGGSGTSILAEALAALVGKTIDEASEALGTMTEDQIKALQKRPDMKAEVARIKAERAAARAEGVQGTDDMDDLKALF